MGMDCNSYIIVRKPTAEDQAFSEEHPFDDLPEGKGLGVGTLSLTSEGHRRERRAELRLAGQAAPVHQH
jgi:hypothetical protein